MKYHGRRRIKYSFYRVGWPSFDQLEEYGNVTGGTLEFSALSEMKVTGSLDYKGGSLDCRDLVRAYVTITDEDGESATHALATMRLQKDKPAVTPSGEEGSMKCCSMLQVLQDKRYPMPFTVPEGTNAVQMAVDLVKSVGLRANNPSGSAYIVRKPHTFDAGESYLSIVNWLLDAAGYSSAGVDPYGIVQVLKYVDPSERPIAWRFVADGTSVMEPRITIDSNYSDSPNVVSLYYDDEDFAVWATAKNVDPDHPASVVRRGSEKVEFEAVDEMDGGAGGELLGRLKDLARKKLADASAGIDYREIPIVWVPVWPNDAISNDCGDGEWKGSVTNMKLSLTASMPCALSARRFVRHDLMIETAGEVMQW